MNEIEQKFYDYWVDNSDLSIEPQYSPFKQMYEDSGSDLTFTQWKKLEDYTNSVTDFLIDGRLCVEVDGAGKHSHNKAGAEKDRQKQNMMLRLGLPTARYAAQSVKNATSYVFDEINQILDAIDVKKEKQK